MAGNVYHVKREPSLWMCTLNGKGSSVFGAGSEPPALRALCVPSGPDPERFGVDFLFINKHGLFGVQRKAVADLAASLDDGRLGSGLAKSQGSLHKTILL